MLWVQLYHKPSPYKGDPVLPRLWNLEAIVKFQAYGGLQGSMGERVGMGGGHPSTLRMLLSKNHTTWFNTTLPLLQEFKALENWATSGRKLLWMQMPLQSHCVLIQIIIPFLQKKKKMYHQFDPRAYSSVHSWRNLNVIISLAPPRGHDMGPSTKTSTLESNLMCYYFHSHSLFPFLVLTKPLIKLRWDFSQTSKSHMAKTFQESVPVFQRLLRDFN